MEVVIPTPTRATQMLIPWELSSLALPLPALITTLSIQVMDVEIQYAGRL